MASLVEREMRWVQAWEDLLTIVGERHAVGCALPDGQVVDVEACKEWLQDSACQGWRLRVEEGWVLGRRGVLVSRFA